MYCEVNSYWPDSSYFYVPSLLILNFKNTKWPKVSSGFKCHTRIKNLLAYLYEFIMNLAIKIIAKPPYTNWAYLIRLGLSIVLEHIFRGLSLVYNLLAYF